MAAWRMEVNVERICRVMRVTLVAVAFFAVFFNLFARKMSIAGLTRVELSTKLKWCKDVFPSFVVSQLL